MRSGNGNRKSLIDTLREVEALLGPVSGPKEPLGSELLDRLAAVFKRFVVVEPHAYTALALWVPHTHALAACSHTPRLVLESPEKRCGKSTLLDLLSLLVANPLATANVTAAAIFHAVNEDQPTLLIDEADNFSKGRDELRKIVNEGFQPGRFVLRVGRRFRTFAPVALAAIGQLPTTIRDRAVTIAMKRAKPTEIVERIRRPNLDAELEPLRDQVEEWVSKNMSLLSVSDPELPSGLDSRARDLWRPLVAIADAASPTWGARAREAARALSGHRDTEDPEVGSLLLADLKPIFGNRPFVATKDLLSKLKLIADHPWADLSPKSLADALRPYGVRPRDKRMGKIVVKGYFREHLVDAWERYTPPPPPPTPAATAPSSSVPAPGPSSPSLPAGNAPQPGGCASVAGAVALPVAAVTSANAGADQGCSAVADESGPARLIWTVGAETKLKGVPSAYVGPTRAHARKTCEGCPLLDNGCLAHGKRFNAVLGKIEKGGAGDTLEGVLTRASEAKVIRMTTIGDATGVVRAEVHHAVSLARGRGLGVIAYTHFWSKEENQDLRHDFMASCDDLSQVSEAVARGWRPAVILPLPPAEMKNVAGRVFVGTRGERILACPHYTKGALCNDCRLCDPMHPVWKAQKIVGIGFPAHGAVSGATPLQADREAA